MKEDYIQNYIDAFEAVLESFTESNAIFKILDNRSVSDLNYDISVIMGFVGDFRGQVNFIMAKGVAMSLTSILAGGMEVTEINELVKSAMGEFSNMVMGNACTLFSEQGISMDITPPSVITGEDFHISNLSPTFCHDIIIDGIGKICFDIAVKN